ncbi:glycosyltransferase family 4 protein [Mycobacterium sp. 1164985.4]|uniref:glycosyltransferase family 4 protein n=1 Tax=Mycobacterium sp. 1164985.4 TaxID=1834069 RepID=UPI0008016515|nr:glycosyltransferase [Mycobacterium sp. 1164985.4]
MVSAQAVPIMGGIETHVHEVSRRLAASGVDVTVLTTDRSGELARTEALSGYRVRRWPAYPRGRDYYISPGLARYLAGAQRNYDVVHVQGVHTFVPPAALAAARRARIPSVLTFHTGGHSSGVRHRLRSLQWKLLGPPLRTATALVAVCEFERRLFAQTLGVPESSIRLIRNGCEPLPVDYSAPSLGGNPLVISVGRLEEYKGHHRILQAMPEILNQAPGAKLALIGSGPFELALRDMARDLGVADRVLIRGYPPGERAGLGKVVSDADVVCLLSEYEAHPVAVMEAIGTGGKALVADTSGLTELGRAGLVTTIPLDASPQEVAAMVLKLAAEPRNAPAQLPTWDDCAEELHSLYREVVR